MHSQLHTLRFETLDFARVRTFYRRDWSWIEGMCAKGGSPAGSRRCSRLMPGPHRSIDIAGSGAPKTSQNGRARGLLRERDRECGMADQPLDDGPGHRRAPFPTSDASGQPVDVVGGRAHKMACSSCVSGAIAHLSKCRCGERRGDATADQGVWDTPGPPSDTAGRSAKISVLFLVPCRGRLKQPHLHCRADAMA